MYACAIWISKSSRASAVRAHSFIPATCFQALTYPDVRNRSATSMLLSHFVRTFAIFNFLLLCAYWLWFGSRFARRKEVLMSRIIWFRWYWQDHGRILENCKSGFRRRKMFKDSNRKKPIWIDLISACTFVLVIKTAYQAYLRKALKILNDMLLLKNMPADFPAEKI